MSREGINPLSLYRVVPFPKPGTSDKTTVSDTIAINRIFQDGENDQ